MTPNHQNPSEVLDIRGEVCPASLVRVKKACESLEEGQKMRVFTDHLPVVEETLPHFAERNGLKVHLLNYQKSPREEWELVIHRVKLDERTEPIINVDGVSKKFAFKGEPFKALDHISLKIHEGEFICLLGPSGCGKSTLLNMLAEFNWPDEGSITGKAGGPLPQRIMIFQELALFPWLNALENVSFGLRYRTMSERARKELAYDYLARVGLKGYEKYRIHHLSGGMRQRVALARALILDPDVLLMDEPFAALDALTKQNLYNDLLSLTGQTGKAVVFITHDVREAVWLADKILVMQPGGKIRAQFDLGKTAPRPIGTDLSDRWIASILPELQAAAEIPKPAPGKIEEISS